MNPEVDQLRKLDLIKRQIQFQNLRFNQKQIQQRQQKLRKQRERQIEQYYIINEKALQAIQNQKFRQYQKKNQVQNILQKSYNQQIQIQNKSKTQQKSIDKFYSQMHKKLLQNNDIRRVKDMSKIYQIKQVNDKKRDRYYTINDKIYEKLNTSFKPQDSLDQLQNHISINLPTPKRQNIRLQTEVLKVDIKKNDIINDESQKQFRINQTNLRVKTQSNPDLRNLRNGLIQNTPLPCRSKYSQSNLDYSDYLKKQIQRKNQQKELKKREQLQKDRLRLQQQLNKHYNQMQEKLFQKEKKKIELSSILDKQIKIKNQRELRLGSNYNMRYLKY